MPTLSYIGTIGRMPQLGNPTEAGLDGHRSSPEPEALPRCFERRLLLKHLARGGMGEVFLAATGGIEGAERPCVVKIIRREHAEDRSFLARFLDEARIQAQLQHPGVAQVLDAATDAAGKPYVVLEFVEGRNLGELRTRAGQLAARIGWADAVAIGIALGDALAHVHERTDAAGKPLDIVHRDLSPQNVMVGYAGDVKLIDFGTARAENRRCHTVAGIVFAKPGYVAPEVANNNPGDRPADLYAFGVMLWELMAGRRFLFGDPAAHLAAVAAGKRNPASLARAINAPEELDRIISKLTAPRIEDRYDSARKATTELVELLKGAPSLSEGGRSVRARIAELMRRLYPAEPERSRSEFARLLSAGQKLKERDQTADVAQVTPSAPNEPGTLCGTRYRIVRELGRGGMGVVYEAFHLDLGRSVALKVLPKEQSHRFGARLRAEARAIAQIDHPNLVKLHDFGISNDEEPFYAMELLEGETLEKYLEREKLINWRDAVGIGIQACRALEAAHDAGVFHRDIKPANLFLTRAQVIKLLDFGVAKAQSEVDGVPETDRNGSGSPPICIIGTPEYMAPEQAAGKTADARSDIYALGAVLYELVTGRPPHSASSTVAVLNAKRERDPEPPRLRVPSRKLPLMVDQAIQCALHRHPECRYQTAAELRRALEDALAEPDRVRVRRRWLAAATVLSITACSLLLAVVGLVQPSVRARTASLAEPALARLTSLLEPLRSAEPARSQAATVTLAAPLPPKARTSEEEPNDTDDIGPGSDVSSLQAIAPDDEVEAPLTESAASYQQTPETAGQDEAGNDAMAVEIARLEALLQRGRESSALSALRQLGQVHDQDPRVLRAWSQAAIRTRAWGEALRVTQQWARVDSSSESQLQLARMLRAAGHHEQVIETLTRLLDQDPQCEEARTMLRAHTRSAPTALGS